MEIEKLLQQEKKKKTWEKGEMNEKTENKQ